MKLQSNERSFLGSETFACSLRGNNVSFRLVDELGDGSHYGGLNYQIIDSEGQQYSGKLDATGYAKLENCYRGPVLINFSELHDFSNRLYWKLMTRDSYPLPITELQVRAEETRFFHQDGFRVEHNPAQKDADDFFQVEVRDLVEHGAHLPPVVKRFFPPVPCGLKKMCELNTELKTPNFFGVTLMPNKHTVLEVRPLRALRPILSTNNEFCALNLYQLALMATMVYNPFGQDPPTRPVDKVSFPLDPSFGHLFGEALANYRQAWRMDPKQSERAYPLYEDVPYSKRFEILPFDPSLYEQNHPDKGEDQEHPASLHFFDDMGKKGGTDTQAFISHHDEIILISVRGTQEGWDIWRDLDALQVPFEVGGEVSGKAHRGFYLAYKAMESFVLKYLDRFYVDQKIIICGHSLGGAITTLLAESLRRNQTQKFDIFLYTYGAPRAGDMTFVEGSSELIHHRIVNNNDPVPGVPAPWMNTERNIWVPAAIMGLSNPYGWLLFGAGLALPGAKSYQHHGMQQHFMPVTFTAGERSSILWDPACVSIEDAALCRLAHEHSKKNGNDMPERGGLLRQVADSDDHKMLVSYIPLAWATLRRWQETQAANQTVVTDREFHFIENAIVRLDEEIAAESKRQRRQPKPVNLRSREDESDDLVSSLSYERDRLRATIERLKGLNVRKVKLVDIYGNATQSPGFDESLTRWMVHKENNAKVQLAMIPSKPDDIYIAGIYQDADPDPMV